jgi:hypothetical protein
MKSAMTGLLFVFGCMAQAALAVVPEEGLWWNPAESGRGYGIELQDDGMFVTYYAYQDNGAKSAFYTTFGRFNSDTGVMTGYFADAKNGQCFGCAYRAPQVTEIGEARFTFTSPTTGRINLPDGVTIPIQRQLYMADGINTPEIMLGVWSIVEGSTLYFGEMLWFRQITTGSPKRFAGHRLGSTARVALGQPTGDAAQPMLALVDYSANYYVAYAFSNSVNRLTGRSWTYPKTGQLSGAGLPFIGSRIMGNTLAGQALNAQSGETKAAADGVDAEVLAEARYAATLAAGDESITTIDSKSYEINDLQAMFAELQADLEASR